MTGDGPVGELFLPLHGEHMARNAALAVAAAEALLGRPLSPEVLQAGFDAVQAPARLELIDSDPPVVLDTAHNPQAVAATLAAEEEAFQFAPVIGVLGMMSDKQVPQVLELLEPVVSTLVVTQAHNSPRVMPVDELADLAGDVFGHDRVIQADDAMAALDQARRLAKASGDQAGVLVLGSVYLAGELRFDVMAQRRREQALMDGPD